LQVCSHQLNRRVTLHFAIASRIYCSQHKSRLGRIILPKQNKQTQQRVAVEPENGQFISVRQVASAAGRSVPRPLLLPCYGRYGGRRRFHATGAAADAPVFSQFAN